MLYINIVLFHIISEYTIFEYTTKVKSYILCKFVLVSGDGLMHFSYFLLKAIDFRA